MPVPLEEIAKHQPRLLRSVKLFADRKINCAHAVLLPYIESESKETRLAILQYAADLGGGICDQRYVCGGLLGGVMALSRFFIQREISIEERRQRIEAFMREFGKRHGSPFCSGITGRAAGTETAYEACRFLVVDTIEAVDRTMAEFDSSGSR